MWSCCGSDSGCGHCHARGTGHARDSDIGCGSSYGCAPGRDIGHNPGRCVDRSHSSGHATVAVVVVMALSVPVTTVAVVEPVKSRGVGFMGDSEGHLGRLPTTT